MKRIFEFDPWKVVTHKLEPKDKRLKERMTTNGNDYMSMRENLEEGYTEDC